MSHLLGYRSSLKKQATNLYHHHPKTRSDIQSRTQRFSKTNFIQQNPKLLICHGIFNIRLYINIEYFNSKILDPRANTHFTVQHKITPIHLFNQFPVTYLTQCEKKKMDLISADLKMNKSRPSLIKVNKCLNQIFKM